MTALTACHFYNRLMFLNALKKNMCILPNDLKTFYLERDGMLIEWKIKIESTISSSGFYRNIRL
jgi:hypothetical protein